MEKRTTCPYDCPDGCGIIATIENGRVVSVRGDMEHPRTKGYLCRKMQHYEEMINHPERILYPLKRAGKKGDGEFKRISWEEAIDEIVSKWKEIIDTYGAEAILPYSFAGTEGLVQEHCGEAFFHYMGATKLKRTICAPAKDAGWKAVMGNSLAMQGWKVAESDRILIWGSNVAATRLHEIPFLKQAKENGAKITLIEVYQSPAAYFCDDVVLVKPGTDGALVMSMIHVLEKEGLTDSEYIQQHVQGYERFKEQLPSCTPEWGEKVTGVPADVIRELAISYGKAERPAILLGSGVSRHKNGAMNVRCIVSLPAIVGSWKNGYGICGTKQSAKWGDKERIIRSDFDKKNARSINMMQLATALDKEQTSPPVMSMYVYVSNPADVTANQSKVLKGLEREDLFTVVHERFMTDTARYADIILPAAFSVEEYDIMCPYGYNGIQYFKKIVAAPGECLSNWDTFVKLAEAMGFDDPYFKMTEEEKCLEYLDRKEGQLAELDDDEWARLLDGFAIVRDSGGMKEIKTESGKVELYNPKVDSPLVGYVSVRKAEETPLHLVAAPSVYTLNSTFTTEKRMTGPRGKMTLIMSEADAKDRGIQDGDQVICENELASVVFYAKVSRGILAGTVVAEGVFTKEQSVNGLTVNALFAEELTDLGEATTMCGNHVQVRLRMEEG